MASSTSAFEIFIGGAMRMTLAYIPPLPTSKPVGARAFEHLVRFLRRGLLGLAILHQFERLHHAHAAHVADQRVLLLQLFELSAEVAADDVSIFAQVFFLDHFDHGARRDRRNGIAAKRRNRQALKFVGQLGGGDRRRRPARRSPCSSPT